jgi:agmatine deiminase
MTQRRLPAEWEPQSGIMLTWPHSASDWQSVLQKVEPVFIEICSHTAAREKVLIVCYDTGNQLRIRQLLAKHQINLDNIILGIAKSNDSWARDHGAISVLENGHPLLLDFQFNAWGGKYRSELDNAITASLNQQGLFRVKTQDVPFVLEGGSIESDGQGCLLTTHCLLSPSRNPGWSQGQIETKLKEQFGLERILWLYNGELAGDDTDAHIDTLARFVSPTKIVYVKCEDNSDPHFNPLLAMERELQAFRTADDKPYQLLGLPLPNPVYNENGHRLPATYANFLIINDAVLLPVYNQTKDQLAIDTLQQCFPTREIIAINCLPLIHQFGSLHCVTMQFPQGILA